MKFKISITAATLSIVLSANAWAESPAPFKSDVATLGRIDAMLTLCIKADAKNRASYERHRLDMIVFGEGTPVEMRVEGSDTPQYKEAYAAMIEAAGKAAPEELADSCRRTIGAEVEKHK